MWDKIKRISLLKKEEKRLLLIYMQDKNFQGILLSKSDGKIVAEECYSSCCSSASLSEEVKPEYEVWIKEQINKIINDWQLKPGDFKLGILAQEVYQEEYTMPSLPIKQAKDLAAAECKYHIPMEEGSFIFNYIIVPNEEECMVKLSAVEKNYVENLEKIFSGLNFKAEFLSGPVPKEETNIEFWNCFCNKEKQKELNQEYAELISLGKVYFQKDRMAYLNMSWEEGEKLQDKTEAFIAYLGIFILVMNIMVLPFFCWQNYINQREKDNLQAWLKNNEEWSLRQKDQQRIQLMINVREKEIKNLQDKHKVYAQWLENLGRLIPGDCWLTLVEFGKDGNLLLQGKSLDIKSVEVFRKQLLMLGECSSCELMGSKRNTENGPVDFTFKVARK